jgi:hypothetical protein
MIKAQVNGVEGNFIFDTGAGAHVVSRRFFEKVKSHVQDSSFFTAFRHNGERLDGPMYQVSGVTLGPIRQDNAWIGVYEGFDDMNFDGLISCKLIEDKIVTVDPKAKQLILETLTSLDKRKKTTLPLLVHEDRQRMVDIFIIVKVQEKYSAIMEFDTGSGYSPILLHSRYMHYAKLDTTAFDIRQSETGFGKKEKTYFDKTKQVLITVPGTNEGGKPNIVYKPSLIYDGLTSYIIFGDKAWTLDIRNRQIHLLD